jgi:hypothetical protein
LGVLYVVDSVTRQWVDQARKTGQQLGSGAPDGTFAAGVTRVTELLPVLMNDITATAPEDQKVWLTSPSYYHRTRHISQGAYRPWSSAEPKESRFKFILVTSFLNIAHPSPSRTGQNQKASGNLGAIKHLSCPFACLYQRKA